MKKIYAAVVFVFCYGSSFSQTPIPFGTSLDSIALDEVFAKANIQSFHCYKPSTYDSSSSPIIFAIHGSGGNGTSAINDLDSIAERRKALIIAPNYAFSGFSGVMRHQEPVLFYLDSIESCFVIGPATYVFKEIYKHVLERENRSSIPSYLIGFSAGGQFVTRYMLIRQAYPDSIPIQMAVSSNAFYYTFPTDTFNNVPMTWTCGLIMPGYSVGHCANTFNIYSWKCPEHIIQYYNENYGVLIGTGDTQPLTGGSCSMAQGNNRYERALNFYNFCDSNAVNRGTTLQWPYVEIPGIGHDQDGMYNTKASPTDSSTIAETLLFDTPYHNVPFTAPVASFYADTTLIQVNSTVNFFNTSINATSYLWDFGDGQTSTAVNPSHTYTAIDTFIVQLTAYNSNSCSNWTEKRHYIKVVNPTGINENAQSYFHISPNPANEFVVISYGFGEGDMLRITDVLGKTIFTKTFTAPTVNCKLQTVNFSPGIYFVEILSGKGKAVSPPATHKPMQRWAGKMVKM